MCEAGDDSQHDPGFAAGGYLNLFITMEFPCRGVLHTWTVFTPWTVTGTLYLGVWRQFGILDYRLQGFNTIQIKGHGWHNYTINESERIRVSTSDFIGIAYPDRPVRGLISYNSSFIHKSFNVAYLRHSHILANDGVLNETSIDGRLIDVANKTCAISAKVIPGKSLIVSHN